MTQFCDLEYFDDELDLSIVVECDRWEILGVHAFDHEGEQVDLSDRKEQFWLDHASEDLMEQQYDRADQAYQLWKERDL